MTSVAKRLPMNPTDKQIEWAARLLCEVYDDNARPDDIRPHSQEPAWEAHTHRASLLLAELERQGRCVRDNERAGMMGPHECWRYPICPDADNG